MAKDKSQYAALKLSVTPSPPAEKATASKDKAGKASTSDRAGDGSPMRCLKKKSVLTDVEGQHAQATS